MYHKRDVCKQEVDIYQIASNNNISPLFVSSKLQKNKLYEMMTEKYPIVLDQVENKRKYYSQLFKLLYKLHGLGIIHGDIQAKNIVIKDGKARFIDFGCSEYIKNLDKKQIREYCEDEGIPNCSINGMLIDEVRKLRMIVIN